MAGKGTFHVRVESNLQGIAVVLRSAACEWLLMFLLLLEAAFSYFLTKFAQYCELQLPCLLCSRLDHILGIEKPDFYRDLLCSEHRWEISSLVWCHIHDKLVDAHEMCEECLLSLAKKEQNQEICKILVGKLGSDCLQKPFFSIDSVPSSLCTRLCTCCAKSWRCRPNVQKLVHSRSSGSLKPDIPLPQSPMRRCLNRQEGLKKRKDRFSVSTTPLVLGTADYDSLSHVGYTEVKITSDSESDFPFSDDEEIVNVPRDRKSAKDNAKLLPKRQYDDFSLIHKSAHNTNVESENGETTTFKLPESNGDVRHSYGETSWQQIRKKASPPLPELASMDDIPLSTSAPAISPVASTDEGDRVSLSKKSGFSHLVFHNNASPSECIQLPVRLPKEMWTDAKANGDTGHNNSWESIDLDSTTITKIIIKPNSMGHTCSVNGHNDLVPTMLKDIKLSGQLERRDCNGVIRSNEEPTTSKLSLAPSSLVSPVLSKTPSMENLDGSASEIEGENVVDMLRKQVKSLYKELEEERSAAAIAANQAMAMITKLQEEKAALRMEALQYLRMMEEQAEYDVDALEKANDMIAEKEKEIQDLEAELDYFRIKYPEDFPEDEDLMHDDINLDLEDAHISNLESIDIEES